MTNSLIANSTGGNPWNIQQNCTVELTNGGGNIQYPQKMTGNWNDYECFGGQTAVNPLLGVLSDNGGPTRTIPLLAGSPAIGGGLNANCPATDQRGFVRVDEQCDAGAYEAGAVVFVPKHMPRPLLKQQLKTGLDAGRQLTLVSAPAGFGKTTCVSDWVQSVSLPSAWLSLDTADDDPGRFFAYLIAALQQIHETIGQRVQDCRRLM